MTLRLGVTTDVDLAPLFFPLEAGWVALPEGATAYTKPLPGLETALLEGSLDVAPISPLIYAHNQSFLRLLPVPVRATDLASDTIFLLSTKRLDQLDKARVAISPNSATGEALLKIIATKYYGITPETFAVASEAAALESLQGTAQTCVVSGEPAMRAVGWAKSKGYFVEDLTKAWWIMTGLPLPTTLFAVRQGWTVEEPNSADLARRLMLAFRRATQTSSEQRPTLLEHNETRTGLPAEALDAHFRTQRYELNEAQLRGLLEFYRRAAVAGLAPLVEDLAFFPALSPLAPTPAPPPRRSQAEAERPRPAASAPAGRDRLGPAQDGGRPSRNNNPRPRSGSRRSEAQAKGLRVIKGGKDSQYERDDDNDDKAEDSSD